ncbi:MAG TPA: pyridoxamine 5'-phosphate oxidase family protein [Mogibacterium sp.]|nr:pyridoxamine 5'-phosphate oxidase family protein [Mogibacterium sp.]
MRRKDREVTNQNAIDTIIENCKILRLGFNDNEGVYIVPVCFAHKHENGKRIFFFHSANEGKKVRILQANPVVGFEMDRGFELQTAEKACHHSAGYQSIIGKGIVSKIETFEDKQKALNLIMSSYTGKSDWTFDEKTLNVTCIFKIYVTELTCKENA